MDDIASNANGQLVLIFDGDDTLWRTHYYYRRIKQQVADKIAYLGVSQVNFTHKVDEYSVSYGNRYGFASERFPIALCQAYKFFLRQAGVAVDPKVLQEIWDMGWKVNTHLPEPMPYLYETLDQLIKDYRLVLYTLGEKGIQQNKLANLNLPRYFKEEDIFIVLRKDPEQLSNILLEHAFNPRLTWMIGNSASLDILPALQLGLNCIWLRSEHWLLNGVDGELSVVPQVNSLKEVLPILQNWKREVI